MARGPEEAAQRQERPAAGSAAFESSGHWTVGLDGQVHDEPEVQFLLAHAPTEVRVGGAERIGDVETGPMLANQFQFPQLGLFRGLARFQFDAFDTMDQPNDAVRFAFGLSVFIVSETNPQIVRLPDVNDFLSSIQHKVNAGRFRSLLEKVFPKPLDEWSLKLEKAQLLHVTILYPAKDGMEA
jgi:hypothetical protein